MNSHQFPGRARDESILKGKGLIILLHDSPEFGKTMTADMSKICFAEKLTHHAAYRIRRRKHQTPAHDYLNGRGGKLGRTTELWAQEALVVCFHLNSNRSDRRGGRLPRSA